MDLHHATGHPASPSSSVIRLSLHGCQESLQPVRDLGTVVPGGGVLQALGSPRNPNSTYSSTGSKSVEGCEGMVAVAEEADAEAVKAVAVVAGGEVAEVAEAAVAEADVAEAGFS